MQVIFLLFNDTLNCWNYIASVTDEWMYMEHSWNDRGQLKYLEKSLSQCYFIHHKSHMDWQRIKTGSLLILFRLRTDSNSEGAHNSRGTRPWGIWSRRGMVAGISTSALDLVVSSCPQLLYTQEESPCYPLDRHLSGSQILGPLDMRKISYLYKALNLNPASSSL